jgi:hypothetical protein
MNREDTRWTGVLEKRDGRWAMAHPPGRRRAGRPKTGIGFSGRVC